MITTPEALLRSIEKFYIEVTEPLDPYFALTLTNLSVKLTETIYTMGYQDGIRNNSPSCDLCENGKCKML